MLIKVRFNPFNTEWTLQSIVFGRLKSSVGGEKVNKIKLTLLFQLLNIIRDNSIIVIVGETGSGKTTQLTQVRKDNPVSTGRERQLIGQK